MPTSSSPTWARSIPARWSAAASPVLGVYRHTDPADARRAPRPRAWSSSCRARGWPGSSRSSSLGCCAALSSVGAAPQPECLRARDGRRCRAPRPSETMRRGAPGRSARLARTHRRRRRRARLRWTSAGSNPEVAPSRSERPVPGRPGTVLETATIALAVAWAIDSSRSGSVSGELGGGARTAPGIAGRRTGRPGTRRIGMPRPTRVDALGVPEGRGRVEAARRRGRRPR